MVNRGRALFQQVNARAHTVRLTKEFKQMDGVESLPHPPFSPEAAPGDYGLFCSMAHFLRDQRFNTFDEVKEACLQFFFFFFFSFFFSFFFLLFFLFFFSLFFLFFFKIESQWTGFWERFRYWLITGRSSRMMDFILKNKCWSCSMKFCHSPSASQVSQDPLANLIYDFYFL